MSGAIDSSSQVEPFRRDYEKLRNQLSAQVAGQPAAVEGVLAGLLAGGHVLLEGLPGTGKTALARALAESLQGATFRRIQFTPDLMAADVIGTYVVLEQQGRRKFEFTQGPIFANIVLADEINRATPKTQAGMLEAMEDAAVTVANENYPLPKPFCVIATQSPNVGEGTFPLPETQLDRFLFKIGMGLPGTEELEMLLERTTRPARTKADVVLTRERVAEMQQLVREVAVGPDVKKLVAKVLTAAQPDGAAASAKIKQYLRQGPSIRGGQAMILGGKVRALSQGRTTVTADDVKHYASAALRHRLVLSFEAHADQVSADTLVAEVLK